MFRYTILTIFLGIVTIPEITAQSQNDSIQIRKFYDMELLNGKSYSWLDTLTHSIGPRLSGSLGAERAVKWGQKVLAQLDLDTVWLQPVMVPKWTRGLPEFAYIETSDDKTIDVPICALGGSVATPGGGLNAPVVEVQGIDDLERYGREQLEGKIVFYNRPMQADLIETFRAYGGAVDQRTAGAGGCKIRCCGHYSAIHEPTSGRLSPCGKYVLWRPSRKSKNSSGSDQHEWCRLAQQYVKT